MVRLLAFLSRGSRVLYALWLVVAMTQPTGAHACPVHDRALAEAMAAHGMAMMHHADTRDAHGSAAEPCHCLGDCCAGLATPLRTTRTTVVPAPAFVLSKSVAPAAGEQSFDSPDRLLPPATAPPTPLVA